MAASASSPKCVSWWETDQRPLQPIGYTDQKLSYQEIQGFTKEELARRQAAQRIAPSFTATKKIPVELTKVLEPDTDRINNQSGLRSKSEPSDAVHQLHTGGDVPSFLRSGKRPTTTPLHDLCASLRLLTHTGLQGTLKRNPLACNQIDSHHRTPLHWLMLSPKLNVTMLSSYLNFNDCACRSGLRIVDSHGECSALDYFMESHQRIGRTEWTKCFIFLSTHPSTAEMLHTCTPLHDVDVLSRGTHLSALPLQKMGGRVNRIRCDAPLARQHMQSNPQMMSDQMRTDRTVEHPDEIKGFELRTASSGRSSTIVGGRIGKNSILM